MVTATINGKEVNLQLDFGACRLFKRATEKNVFGLDDDDWNDPDLVAALLVSCAQRGGSELTDEDVDTLSLHEVPAIVQQLMAQFAPEPKGDSPNAAGQN